MNQESGVPIFISGLAIRLAMACIFAQSAYHALRDSSAYGNVLEQYRLLPSAFVRAFALLLPLAMLATAVGLLIPRTSQLSGLAGVGLMALFTLAITINLSRGRIHIDCGCGGPDGQRLSRGLIVRNVVSIALLLYAASAPQQGVLDVAGAIGAFGGACVSVAFYFAANALLHNRAALRAAGE